MRSNDLLLVVIAFAFFSACSPRLSPFTQRLYDEYEWSEEDLKKVQFYLSEDIALTRKLSSGQAEIVDGEVKIVDGQRIEEVIIQSGTPGELLFIPKENRFAIGFEAGSDRYLMFGPNPKVGDRYVLLAADWDRRSGEITYDGKSFMTSTRSALATLMIDLKHINDISRKTRVAGGRVVNK